MRSEICSVLAIGTCLLFAWVSPSPAQETFFKGKIIRIIVGLPPGGGYDTYSRLIARHMGKHIPGNPGIAVENMDGAGSLIAANHIFKVAKPDGLSIGHFQGGLFLQQLLGKAGIEFDAAKFEYLGVPTQDHWMVGLSKATGITSIEKLIASKTVVKFGGSTPGSGTDDITRVLVHTLGLPIQLVSGYKGTGPIRLAFNSGEVQGLTNAWESFRSTWRKELESGDVVIILQATVKAHPDFPNVPVALDLAKTEEARKLIQVQLRVQGPSARPYVLPPKTPNDRVQILRIAFMDTMKDPDFLAEAKKANLDINPDDGAALEKNVREVLKLDRSLVAKLTEILK